MRQGAGSILASMVILFVHRGCVILWPLEGERQPKLNPAGVTQSRDRRRTRAATSKARSCEYGVGGLDASTPTTITATSAGRDELRARELHAARRLGAAGQHDARRGEPGR